MIVKESYDITIRKDMTCSAGAAVFKMTDKLKETEELPVKLIIGDEKKNGQWAVYLEKVSENSEKMVGKIASLKDKSGNDFDDVDIDNLIKENYRIVITGPQKNPLLVGKLQLLKDEASANKASDKDTADTLKKMIDEKIKTGIVTKEDMDQRLKVFRANGVDDFLLTRIIK